MALSEEKGAALNAAVTEWLYRLFEEHHVMPVLEEGEIHFCGSSHRLSAQVEVHPRQGAVHLIQLNVRMVVGPGLVVHESLVGVGATPEDAVKNAVEAFSENVLHVLLSAFLDSPNERASYEKWTVSGVERTVSTGDLGMRGTPPVTGEALVAWFPQLEALIKGSCLPPGTHWVRFYYAQQNNRPTICELLLDNEPWEALLPAVSALPFPKGKEFYSFRIFMVLDGGTDLPQILSSMLRLKERDDEVICEDLVRQGMPQAEAFKAVTLVPLAVARVFLGSLGVRFSDTATVIPAETGTAVVRLLQEERFYREAYRLAEEARANGSMTREEVTTLSLRSAEFRAVNQALHAGSPPGDLVLSPPLIPGWPEVPEVSALVSVSPAGVSDATVGTRKPWWQFWG